MYDDIHMVDGALIHRDSGPPYYELLKPNPPSPVPPLNPNRAMRDGKPNSAPPNRDLPLMSGLPSGYHAKNSEKHRHGGNFSQTEYLENNQNGNPEQDQDQGQDLDQNQNNQKHYHHAHDQEKNHNLHPHQYRQLRPQSDPQSLLSAHTSILTSSWSPRSSADTTGAILQHPLNAQPMGGDRNSTTRDLQQEKLAQELISCQRQLDKTRDEFEAQRAALLKEIAELQTQVRLKKKQQVGVRRAAEKAAELEIEAQQRRFEQRITELELEWKLREDAIWSQFWEMRESDLAESNREWDKRETSIKAECRSYLQQAEQANSEIRALVEKLETELGHEKHQREKLEHEAKERSRLLNRTYQELEHEVEMESAIGGSQKGKESEKKANDVGRTGQSQKGSKEDHLQDVVEPAAPPRPQYDHTSDEELVASIKKLRVSIRHFIDTFLEPPKENLHHPVQVQSGRSTASMKSKTAILGCVNLSGQLREAVHLVYTDKFHRFMEALLWKYLESRVLGNFIWAGRAAANLKGLFEALRPGTPEIKQELQHWRFATVRLILAAGGDRTSMEIQYQTKRDSAIAEIWSLTEGTKHKVENWDEYLAAIGNLVDQAATLDKEVYMRPYITSWRECDPETHRNFDPQLMTTQNGELSPPGSSTRLMLMIFPGLVREALEDMGEDELLLPLEVLCRTGARDRGDTSHGVRREASYERPQSEPAAPLFSRKGFSQAAAATLYEDGNPKRRRTVSGILKRVWEYGQPAAVPGPPR